MSTQLDAFSVSSRAGSASAMRSTPRAGRQLLEVKTLGPSYPSEHYERTRRFYERRGFVSLEELHGLWPNNPCLIMVKFLSAPSPGQPARNE
jgi:hypothetical protein